MTGTRLTAALAGDLERFMADELKLAAKAVGEGVYRTAQETKLALRADVMRAGLGRKVANSWRSQSYPPDRESLRAAAIIWSKAEHLIEAFDGGATIKAERKKWLAIPTEFAPKRVGRKSKRITPSNWPEQRYGKLRFVQHPRKKTAMLVVDNQRRRGGKARQAKQTMFQLSRSKRALASGRGLFTVPMFILVPQVRMRKRLNVEAAYAYSAQRLALNINEEFRAWGRTR